MFMTEPGGKGCERVMHANIPSAYFAKGRGE